MPTSTIDRDRLLRILADALCNEYASRFHDGTGGYHIGRPRGVAGFNGVACEEHQTIALRVFEELEALTRAVEARPDDAWTPLQVRLNRE